MKMFFCLLPYMLFLLMQIIGYSMQMNKGKDVFQAYQLINVTFLCAIFASDCNSTFLTRSEMPIAIGLHSILYSAYWVICLFIRRKHIRKGHL